MKPRRLALASALAWLMAIALACANANSPARDEASRPAAQAGSRERVIDHVVPARDSAGAAPATFQWSAIPEAERYSIGVWSEVDRLMWRRDDVKATTVEWPSEIKLDLGTYFWSVTAWGKERPIAESGLAAFVVTR